MKLKNKYYKYKVGIVLGGLLMIPNRCRKAIELYNTRKINYILLSGGIGYFNKNRQYSEARLMYNYLVNNGIDSKKIILEEYSRNTYQNALYCKNILWSKFNITKDKFFLITSDSHMMRSYLLFKAIIKDINLDCCSSEDKFKCMFFYKINLYKESFLIKYYKFRKII